MKVEIMLLDFEALTPNLLARTIETVQGGGLIILLIRSLSSLTCLYTMVMRGGGGEDAGGRRRCGGVIVVFKVRSNVLLSAQNFSEMVD
ncbi:UPF0202 plant-like protein [Artemisia annua]|uniref:UPF0202 plant-like protein n=1 Tax=Artemisia annua TaxID=35608 RepID=A0A2U1MB84_ARTAN|nr:UPF0202 plant-like protein [Artemisia annua]